MIPKQTTSKAEAGATDQTDEFLLLVLESEERIGLYREAA